MKALQFRGKRWTLEPQAMDREFVAHAQAMAQGSGDVIDPVFFLAEDGHKVAAMEGFFSKDDGREAIIVAVEDDRNVPTGYYGVLDYYGGGRGGSWARVFGPVATRREASAAWNRWRRRTR